MPFPKSLPFKEHPPRSLTSPFLLARKPDLLPRFRLFPFLRTAVFPPENRAKNEDHEIDPEDHHPLSPTYINLSVSSFPIFAHLEEFFRVISNNPIQPITDRPRHHTLLIYRPHEHGSALRFRISQEPSAEVGDYERFLQYIEGHVGYGEELSRVGYRKADV